MASLVSAVIAFDPSDTTYSIIPTDTGESIVPACTVYAQSIDEKTGSLTMPDPIRYFVTGGFAPSAMANNNPDVDTKLAQY
jgi:hypothetical protein